MLLQYGLTTVKLLLPKRLASHFPLRLAYISLSKRYIFEKAKMIFLNVSTVHFTYMIYFSNASGALAVAAVMKAVFLKTTVAYVTTQL